MNDVIIYLGAASAGLLLGSILKKQNIVIKWTAPLQSICLYILILVMGMRMGSNREVIDNLGCIGFSALVFTLFAQAGTIACMFAARRLMGFDRKGRLIQPSEDKEKTDKNNAPGRFNKSTVIVVLAVFAGILLGYFAILKYTEAGIIFKGDIDNFSKLAAAVIRAGLIALLIFVGMDLSKEENVLANIKSAGLRILVFPAAAAIGSLLGAFISGLILRINLNEALAIGSGFGWYTLAPGMIMDAGCVRASAIAFLHNVSRELAAIVFMPIIAVKVGYIECCAMGGAASMDVTLPVAVKATDASMAIYSFVIGVVLTIFVPILVPLMLAL